MDNRLLIGFGIFIFTLAACRPSGNRSVTSAFYHWQTEFEITPEENAYLDSIGCKKLYVKVLDIGMSEISGGIEPYSRVQIRDTTGISKWEIVPTIFITNAVFKTITPEKTDWLAGKISAALAESPFGKNTREIQFDCDWTASTRAAFFLFLKKMKQALPEKNLSATIRLHQYKFPEQTGVPPVSRGMLMFYNTGDIGSEATKNSIFDLKDALKYVEGAPKHYPLPLDLALPLFSWTLIYREGEFWKIVNGIPPDLRDTTRFETDMQDSTRLQVRKGTFLAGHYLRPGDRLRVEKIPAGLLQEAAQLAARMDLAGDMTLAYFYLDSTIIRQFSPKLIHSVCQKTGFTGNN
jgi:hypothetical protein